MSVPVLARARVALVLGMLSLAACRPNATTAPDGGAAASGAQTAAASAAPPVDAATLVSQQCLTCHAEDLLAQQRITRAQWGAVVKKMQGWGAMLTDAQLAPVADHLAARYPASLPTAEPEPMSARAAEEAFAPQPDGPLAGGNVGRGTALFAQRCAVCHGPAARGDGAGINLVQRPILQRARELAQTVRLGRRGMPAHVLDDSALADLLSFLRTLR